MAYGHSMALILDATKDADDQMNHVYPYCSGCHMLVDGEWPAAVALILGVI